MFRWIFFQDLKFRIVNTGHGLGERQAEPQYGLGENKEGNLQHESSAHWLLLILDPWLIPEEESDQLRPHRARVHPPYGTQGHQGILGITKKQGAGVGRGHLLNALNVAVQISCTMKAQWLALIVATLLPQIDILEKYDSTCYLLQLLIFWAQLQELWGVCYEKQTWMLYCTDFNFLSEIFLEIIFVKRYFCFFSVWKH